MRVVSGRPFDALDPPGDRGVVIVNETVVERYFRDVDPIGRSISIEAGEFDIVGVVSDIRHGGLLSKYESEVFLPYGRPISTNEMHVVVQSDVDTAVVAGAFREILRDMDPQLAPSQIVAISELLWESVAQPRFNTVLLVVLAFCGAVLAVIGTYGIVAFSVSQRTREIGLRMALGADAAATMKVIVRHALGIVLAGAGLGAVVALGATRILSDQLIEVNSTDPLTYGVVLIGAILVGLMAAWAPARRATRIDPIEALRDG
jgi:putative ABC transport system permease protein